MTRPNAREQYMLKLINAERAAVGVKPLVFDDHLQESTDAHSKWMLASDVFAHEGANGSNPSERMKEAGYRLTGTWASAENIAWVSLRSPEDYRDEVRLLHKNLMNSPGHRENILNPDFQEIGIGIKIGNMQGWDAAVVTQNFGLSSAPSTPPPDWLI
jgi:serralysin